jgi:metallo-beta-lactamase family protein
MDWMPFDRSQTLHGALRVQSARPRQSCYCRVVADLTFLGAARTVTGSKYLLDHGGARVLFDCGLFQGLKELRLRNWEEFPIPPSSIDAVVLTHAHLDHVGYLPRLVAQGFSGRVFCTAATRELSTIVLPDSGRIQEEDARQANRHGYSKHAPALALYDEAAAHRALTHLHPIGYNREVEIVSGITVEFMQAGHLLGSSFIKVRSSNGPTLLFGGDLGRYNRPVLPDPADAVAADVMLVESTYGDRNHPPDDDGEALGRIVRDVAGRSGKLIIPSFAIGRVEELLYWLRRLEQQHRIPVLPVYVDSPMANEALQYYVRRTLELDPEMRPEGKNVSMFATGRFRPIASPQESKQLTASRKTSIVISSSGMATGGRVLHHLAAALPDERNTVLFVGYQAAGTGGRSLVDGVTGVKIHGALGPVRARVEHIDSMSAHADRGEIVRWLRTAPASPNRLFLVHGEPPAMDAMARTIEQQLGWRAYMPEHGERVSL